MPILISTTQQGSLDFGARSRWSGGALLALVGVALVTGCGKKAPELAPVQGAVSMKDQPVTEMVINFRPQGDTAGSGGLGALDAQGKFTATDVRGGAGLHPGAYKVYFYPAPASGGAPDDPAAVVAPPSTSKLPKIYLDMRRTPLVADIPPSGGVVDIQIADKPEDSTVVVHGAE
ncbi:MAG: hypothetical protein KDA37_17230 [Planctomycetales bacterium]|nr:hypothetical protein [Planctomycetales bacterium]